ncbi:hypothetical protein [Polycladidibacter hongkongensis]|uniref:hypothetical protein n=1 Tax=Polycladidibacter hongkongensis TaxID=1647556 RepID=UPI001FCB0C80|nr:hypothetical protein [Pseudovibrio hongkongensis]
MGGSRVVVVRAVDGHAVDGANAVVGVEACDGDDRHRDQAEPQRPRLGPDAELAGNTGKSGSRCR